MMAGQERSNHIMRLRKPAVVTAVVIVILFGVSFVYYYCHTIINDGLLYEINSSSYVYEVEKAAIEQDELVLQGWCFHLDEDLEARDGFLELHLEKHVFVRHLFFSPCAFTDDAAAIVSDHIGRLCRNTCDQ